MLKLVKNLGVVISIVHKNLHDMLKEELFEAKVKRIEIAERYFKLGYSVEHVNKKLEIDYYKECEEIKQIKSLKAKNEENENNDEDNISIVAKRRRKISRRKFQSIKESEKQISNKINLSKNNNDNIMNDLEIKYIYHMTHYSNIKNILNNGLYSHSNALVHKHIDNKEVNDRRNKAEPIYKKNLHSYVPFYFNPKNPMLFVNKEYQNDIVILAFSRNLLFEESTIFTDGNAAANKTKYYKKIEDLGKLNWKCLHANNWIDFEDGKREKMAEILIPQKVSIQYLEKIYCYDSETKNYILNLNTQLQVEINTSFYFNLKTKVEKKSFF